MSVAYSSAANKLTVYGTAEILNLWDVRITSVTAQYTSENCDEGNPQFSNTSVTINAKLAKPGDYITYLIIIQNFGTTNAILKNMNFTSEETGSPAIVYTVSEPAETLPAGGFAYYMVQVMYSEDTTQMPEVKTKTITGVIEYSQE